MPRFVDASTGYRVRTWHGPRIRHGIGMGIGCLALAVANGSNRSLFEMAASEFSNKRSVAGIGAAEIHPLPWVGATHRYSVVDHLFV